ncbi:MAG TPA: glycosyltransferase family 4 protein [Dongiaceae bacterium]|nr:glycosyltransferase family 4 protein [Dongiaceae bacterium]
MKIAQVAPLYESVPPKLYGGTERVVSYLTEELVRLGHDVTLFASGDSVTTARLESCCATALRLSETCCDPMAHHTVMLDKVLAKATQFDVLHFHTDYAHFPITRALQLPSVTTLHGRLDLPDLVPLYQQFDRLPLVSISQSQRQPLGRVQWIGNVYHGLPVNSFRLNPRGGDYLAFLGRISPEKRPDRAIEIAQKAGMKLKIAAKVDKADVDYFETIRPLIEQPHVEFVGEIQETEKQEFLGNAYAYLFPIDWPEPFGLTMIEAMACGTPTIAFRNGSVPEILDEGVTGFLVDNEEGAVRAVGRVQTFNRARCRATFERRFTSCRMAKDYLSIYEALVENSFLSQTVHSMEISTTVLS